MDHFVTSNRRVVLCRQMHTSDVGKQHVFPWKENLLFVTPPCARLSERDLIRGSSGADTRLDRSAWWGLPLIRLRMSGQPREDGCPADRYRWIERKEPRLLLRRQMALADVA